MAIFSQLTDHLQDAFKTLKGEKTLSASNLAEVTRLIEDALINADCAYDVAMDFTKRVKEKALGQKVVGRLKPDQVFIKIVHEELTGLLKHDLPPSELLNLNQSPPAIILLAGLQGAGKTTTAVRLGKWIQDTLKKDVALVSTDVYRPAAIDQLETLGKQAKLEVLPSHQSEKPIDITKKAIEQARKTHKDVLIIDTAGRGHLDDDMMNEIKMIQKESRPTETLFVVDSMTGQDAAESAKAFHQALPEMSGIIVTKTDGDARGGAILSLCAIIQQPIKFIGTGEKIRDLDFFNAERVASSILDMGDIVAFAKEVEANIDQKRVEKSMKKISKGQFNMEDLATQLEQASTMDISAMMQHLPGNLQRGNPEIDQKKIQHQLAVIRSMTRKEKQHPEGLKGSQKRRIAAGSGTDLSMVLSVLKLYKTMSKMSKKINQTSFKKKMKQFQDQNPSDLF